MHAMDARSLQHAGLVLPGGARSAVLAREFTRRTLTRWRYRGSCDEAVLVVSELVTNAVLHAGGGAVLRLLGTGSWLRVEVTDGSPVPPAKRESGSDGGWGLKLVERLTTTWGVLERDGGKVVWCELAARLSAVAATEVVA